MEIEFGAYVSYESLFRGKRVSSIEDKGIYNPAVKKQVRKDKFGKDSLSFMILGSQDQKKNGVFLLLFLTWFYGFSHSKYIVRNEFQDFKEDDIKSDMTIDDVNFTLAFCLVIKNTCYTLKD